MLAQRICQQNVMVVPITLRFFISCCPRQNAFKSVLAVAIWWQLARIFQCYVFCYVCFFIHLSIRLYSYVRVVFTPGRGRQRGSRTKHHNACISLLLLKFHYNFHRRTSLSKTLDSFLTNLIMKCCNLPRLPHPSTLHLLKQQKNCSNYTHLPKQNQPN